MHRADQHSSWRLDSQNRPSKADGKGQRVDRSADNAGAILSAWHDRCPIPGIIADVDYIYYGLAGIILLAALYYFIALPKLSAESAEIDVQAALKRQKIQKRK